MSVAAVHSKPPLEQKSWEYLQFRLAHLKLEVTKHLESGQPIAWAEHFDPQTRLGHASQAFKLNPPEESLLLLALGLEQDLELARLCAKATGLEEIRPASLALAQKLFGHQPAYTAALLPSAALRRWGLLEISAQPNGQPTGWQPLRVSEGALAYFCGLPLQHPEASDAQLSGARCLDPALSSVASQNEAALRLASVWQRLEPIQLLGSLLEGQTVAALACQPLELGLLYFPLERQLAQNPQQLAASLGREAVLRQSAWLLGLENPEPSKLEFLTLVVEHLKGLGVPFALVVRERQNLPQCAVLELKRASSAEQVEFWQQQLRGRLEVAPEVLRQTASELTAQFDLETQTIQQAIQQGLTELMYQTQQGLALGTAHLHSALWKACRAQARHKLDRVGSAQHLEAQTQRGDLVLSEVIHQTLDEIRSHVRHRGLVYDQQGYRVGERGRGVAVLFSGPSGTGKTTAAEVLAGELELDLYRIDLSMVVSKYIGETEKNLRQVFDAAEDGACVLLFDEADALFGKRSDVQDSHDRYANLEVSYLLQRMEQYKGLAILTTNLENALDDAFLRRLRFVVRFQRPKPPEREAIWQKLVPPQFQGGLDFERLSRLELTGGNIANIVLQAAFKAAAEGRDLDMKHLKAAAVEELGKLKRLVPRELEGW